MEVFYGTIYIYLQAIIPTSRPLSELRLDGAIISDFSLFHRAFGEGKILSIISDVHHASSVALMPEQ
jgi:hypothetical protein